MKRIARFSIFFVVVIFSNHSLLAQDDKKVLGEVTVVANDATYTNLRGISNSTGAFSGDYATVNNVVLKKDAGVFTLKTGEIYFLQAVEGRVFGAVFIGSGEFFLKPPVEVEQQHLELFTDAPELKEAFSKLTIFFTDTTFETIKSMPGVVMGKGGPQAERARSAFRDKEKLLREQFRSNITSRILSDIYTPGRPGFFAAFIEGEKHGKLLYGIDPLGHAEVYPEQVELMSYSDSTGGIWTAFHMENEYAKGTATSWTDRRTYDIKHHNIDAAVDGTRLTITDEITIEMREANSRFIPFDLFRSLRVQSVKDEAGNALMFIQERKEEDADFGVILPAALPVGKTFKLKIAYEGNEALREAGSGNFILIPRSTWYPNNPSTAFGDRATFDAVFRYPKRFVMVGVGTRVGDEIVEGNTKVSKWSSEGVELAVGGFNYGDFQMKPLADEITGLKLEVYTNRELPDEIKSVQMQGQRIGSSIGSGGNGTTLGSLNTGSMADTVLNEAQNSTRLYTTYFGKLPYKRVAMTQQPAGNFGQAWPTLIFMPYTAFFDSTSRVQLFGIGNGTNGFWREVAAHEVAHQWWGHSVGWTSYHDQWMSEGFSEFSTSLFILYAKKDFNKFLAFWDDQKRRITEGSQATMGRKPYTVGPVTQGYRLNSAKTGAVAQSMMYPKGAFILQMLRMMMYDHVQGTKDTRFQRMMQDFIVTNYNKDISTNDLKLAVEKHMVPGMNLKKNGKMDWFFDEWVYGTEMPSYKFTYSVSQDSNGRSILNAQIEQSGVSKNFMMLVPVYLDYGRGPAYLGSATMAGNTTVELKNVVLPAAPKSASLAALQDILAGKIENIKQ